MKLSGYKQTQIRRNGDIQSIDMIVWLPSSLAVIGKIIEIQGHYQEQWEVIKVWPFEVTMEDISNQRDARKDRAATIR